MSAFNIKSILLGGVIGAAIAVAAISATTASNHAKRLGTPSGAAVAMPLKPIEVDKSWVKAGTPNFRMATYASGLGNITGIWACDASTFEWHFGSDELVYITDGSVDIDYLGKKFTLKVGDTALFLAGTKAVWHTPNGLRKSFTLYQPNAITRWLRGTPAGS
jgi:uncharacterized protein